MVNFGQKPNYEVILGHPFMQKLKMIQDQGYNYIYLCHSHAITHVNLKDHSYKNVINNLVQDMVSRAANEDLIPSRLIQNKLVGTCELNEDSDKDGLTSSLDCIAKPFVEHELEPFRWYDILATLDFY